VGVAAGTDEREVPILVPVGPVFATSSSLIPGGRSRMDSLPLTVTQKSLDQITQDQLQKWGPDQNMVLKLDVEGYELEVLGGSTELLRMAKPTILFECHKDGPAGEIAALLEPFG